MRNIKKNIYIYIYLLIYFFINLSFLTNFPFVHSDESWLSGLSRNIALSNSFKVTEPFFDLYPRYPHAIKIIFQSFQIVFYKIFGYDIFTFRLMSLFFAIICLVLVYKLAIKLFNKDYLAFFATLLVSLDIQFIYAAHFARTEIIILTFFLTALNCYFGSHKKYTGIIIGLSIGIHPNSFIIALAIGIIFLYDFLKQKTTFKDLILYILEVFVFALIFIGISFYLDSNFFKNYFNYGSQFGVNNSLLNKFKEIFNFYKKIYYQVSITYYIPNVILELVLLIILSIATLINKNKNNILLILLIFGINIGIIFIGRFNTTSIVLFFPLIYLLLISTIDLSSHKIIILVIVFILVIINSLANIIPNTNNDYNNYLTNISKYVKPSDKVLANLNCEYYFDNDSLLDYRNLYYLKSNNESFEDYITSNKIKYIIYSEELDYIYNTRPVWNVVYGNLYYYYNDMQEFLINNTTLIASFESYYGMRIVSLQNEKWKIKIYQVN